MPRILRAIAQAALGLALAVCSIAGQSAPPAGGTQQSPTSPPRTAAGQTPEHLAFYEASHIQDPVEKLAALRKVRADLAGPTAAYLGRQLDEAILWHLVAQFRDREEEIADAFKRVLGHLPQGSAEVRLGQLLSMVNRLLDNKIDLDEAESAVRVELTTLDQSSSDASTRTPRVDMADTTLRVNTLRGRALETLGRWHLERGQEDLAFREFKEALNFNSALIRAPIALAEVEIKRGNKAGALEYYTAAAATGKLKPAEERAFRGLFIELHGSDAELAAALDRAYDARFPNPIKPEPYEPRGAAASRVVLLELFTGSACGPCVSADLSWDALLARYPDTVIAPLAYHAHIPGPDPMVIAGGDARRLFYGVRGVPTLHIDGARGTVGGGSRDVATRTYGEYIAAIDKALSKAPTATIEVGATRSGSRIDVTAKASGLPPGTADLRLHIVLAERHLAYAGENGIRHHAMVVRAVAGENGSGIAIRGSSDTVADYTFDLLAIRADVDRSLDDEIASRRKTASSTAVTPPDYRAEGHAMNAVDPAGLVVIAFVQDASKTVLQAARVNVK